MGKKFSGKDGRVTFSGGYTAHVKSWSAEISAELLEATELEQSTKDFVPDLLEWNGQYVCFLDSETITALNNIKSQGDPGAAEFIFGNGRKITGSILMSGISSGAEAGSTVEVTISFQGCGDFNFV